MQAYSVEVGDVVLDGGAGIGEDTLAFAEAVGQTGKVIAVEAHPRTSRCLRKTVIHSQLHNVQVVECALAYEDGEVRFQDGPSHLTNRVMEAGGIPVRAQSLEGLIRELALDHVDLLKLNVEGAELEALRGLGAAARSVRNVVVSCHDFLSDAGGPEDLRTKAAVRSELQSMGFEVLQPREASTPWGRDIVEGVQLE